MTAPETAAGPMDAITKGTVQGVELLLNIVAMLIVLVALVQPGQLGARPSAGRLRWADHPAAGHGSSHGAGLLADGGAVRAKRRRPAP